MSYIESVPLGLWKNLVERYGSSKPALACHRPTADGSALGARSEYERRELDVEKVHFKGVIVFRNYRDTRVSVIVFPSEQDATDELGGHHLIKVSAGPVNTGMWAAGKGEYFRELVTLECGISESSLSLMTPIGRAMARFKAEVLQIAATLAEGVVGDGYWEVERDPTGGYMRMP